MASYYWKIRKFWIYPPNSDFEYAGTNLYVPKINQRGETDDWRYLQGYSFLIHQNGLMVFH